MSAHARSRRWWNRSPDLPVGVAAGSGPERDGSAPRWRAFGVPVDGGAARRAGQPARGPEDELAAQLRALRATMPQRGVGTVFPEIVRSRARRHRSRARVAGAAALVVAVAVGVGVPVTLAAGGSAAHGGAGSAVGANPGHTFGGVTVTWLPAGMTHGSDQAVQVMSNGSGWALSGAAPPLTSAAQLIGPTTFISRFVAGASPAASSADRAAAPVTSSPAPATTGGTDGAPATSARATTATTTTAAASLAAAAPGDLTAPAGLWVTVSWPPQTTTTVDVPAQLAAMSSQIGAADISSTTLGGRPALFVQIDHTGADPATFPYWTSNRYSSLLTWVTTGGVRLAVEATADSPPSLVLLRQVGEALVLGHRPPNPTYDPVPVPPTQAANPPDEATATAVKTALHDVFTHGVTPAQFSAAVEDGAALRAVSDRVIAHFPQLGATVEVTVNQLTQTAPDTVSAAITLSFTDPTVPTLLNHDFPYTYGLIATVRHTAGGWKVSRDSYCSTVTALGVPELACPPA